MTTVSKKTKKTKKKMGSNILYTANIFDWPDTVQAHMLNCSFFRSKDRNGFEYRRPFTMGKQWAPWESGKMIAADKHPLWRKITAAIIASEKQLDKDERLSVARSIIGMSEPKRGDKIYFDPACTVPRNDLKEAFAKAARPSTADIVIVPNSSPSPIIIKPSAWVFVDEKAKSLWLLVEEKIPSESLGEPYPELGMTIKEFMSIRENRIYSGNYTMSNNFEEIGKASNAKCVYAGPIVTLQATDNWIHMAALGIYKRVALESEAMKVAAGRENDLDYSRYITLERMMESLDIDNVKLAMRTLASLNWQEKKSVAAYLCYIGKHDWWDKIGKSKSLSYMFKSLGVTGRSMFTSTIRPTAEELEKDKDIFEHIVRRELMKETEHMLKSCSFEADLEFDITLKPYNHARD